MIEDKILEHFGWFCFRHHFWHDTSHTHHTYRKMRDETVISISIINVFTRKKCINFARECKLVMHKFDADREVFFFSRLWVMDLKRDRRKKDPSFKERNKWIACKDEQTRTRTQICCFARRWRQDEHKRVNEGWRITEDQRQRRPWRVFFFSKVIQVHH